MIKNKCITVKSQTYAQKAERILRENGLNAYVVRRTEGKSSGCERCVKVNADFLPRALALLKAGGVEMTGEVYDI